MQSKQRPEKMRQTELIGVRISAASKRHLDLLAKDQGISATSCARLLLCQSLGGCQEVPTRPSARRRSRKPVSDELRNAISVLGTLQDIRQELSTLSRSLGNTRLESRDPTKIMDAIDQMTDMLASIQDILTGDEQ